jgi:transposase InsO family protein
MAHTFKYRGFLNLTDSTFAIALAHRSADAVVQLLRQQIALFGKPRAVLSDNGEEFLSYVFQNLLQRLTIEHLHTSPYHPQRSPRNIQRYAGTNFRSILRSW